MSIMKGANYIPNKMGVASTYKNGCSKIIAVADCSRGNAESGIADSEAATFSKDATLDEVLNWALSVGVTGKLYITPDLSSYKVVVK